MGLRSITATYQGDSNFLTTTSASLKQTVQKAETTTDLVSSVNPSVYGQSVTFTATVSVVAPGGGAPAGSVTFKDGSTTLGSVVLAGGVATYTTSKLAVATHSITAIYAGNTSYVSSTSPVLSQEVDQSPTSTALVSSINPTVYGQSVTFTATVSAASPGSGTPTGTVTFYDGTTAIGTGTLNSSRQAKLTTSALGAGTHTITATYNGDAKFLTSTTTLGQTVDQADTKTSLTSSSTQSVYGQAVTLTATVTTVSPGKGTPTGQVEFYDGTTDLGSGTLGSTGKATFVTSYLSVGSHSLQAVYLGDVDFLTSTSTAVSHPVTQASTRTSLQSSANPSTRAVEVTFTATISVASPGSGTPTGTVTFYDGTIRDRHRRRERRRRDVQHVVLVHGYPLDQGGLRGRHELQGEHIGRPEAGRPELCR